MSTVTAHQRASGESTSSKGPPQTSQGSSSGSSSSRKLRGSSNSGSGSGGSRRVTIIGGGMEERSNSFRSSSHPLQMEHGGVGDIFGRRPTGMPNLGDTDLFGSSWRGSESFDAAAIDAAILGFTRRRISHSFPGGAADPIGERRDSSSSNAPYGRHTSAASLAARQRQLHLQQRELEQRQKELEIQRQQLVAGMQEHAKSTSLFAQQSLAPLCPSQQQQWWVCQVCNSKAFASHDEAMHHELQCCPEPQRFEAMDAAMHLPSDFYGSFGFPYSPSGRSGSPVSDNGMEPLSNADGPFSVLSEPIPLAMESDKDWLTPLHCFVRRHCVQLFTATECDVSTPSKGKRKPIQVGQVGIRCPHCYSEETNGKARERGSVYYPTSISSIYNATMNLLQRHLHKCSSVPEDIMRRYETLKSDDARSGTSKKYWIESSLSLGLVDTPRGIRFSVNEPPPLPSLSSQQHSTGSYSVERRNSNDFFSSDSNAVADLKADEGLTTSLMDSPDSEIDAEGNEDRKVSDTDQSLAKSAPLVMPDDEPYSTKFSYHLMSQMQPCVFTEADRLGKRKGLPPGFPGLACRHCFGGYGSGRFFPSSIKTLSDTSKTLNVLHNHMMRCRKCPQEVRETLEKLRTSHDEERGKMKFGSQKAFFARVWGRLHHIDGITGDSEPPHSPDRKRKAAGPPGQYSPVSPAPPPLAHSLYVDTRYFGPPLASQIAAGTLSHHNSFSGLDSFGSPLDISDPKRAR